MNGPQAKEERRQPLLVRFPLKSRSKEPAVRFKSCNVFNVDGVENVGERLDGMIVLDIDPRNMPEGVTLDGTLEKLRGMGVPVDACPRVRTGSGGEHVKMRLPDDAPRLRAKLLPWVDVKSGRGAYVVAAGSVHPNGSRYETLNDVSAEDAPFAPPQLLKTLRRAAPAGEASPPGRLDSDRLAVVLDALDPIEFREHDRWLELMMACRHACPEGVYEFVEWSTSDAVYAGDAEKIAERWYSIDPFAEGGVTIASLYERIIEKRTARPEDNALRRALAVMDFAEIPSHAGSLVDEGAGRGIANHGLIGPADTLDLAGIEAKRRNGQMTDSYKTALFLMDQLQPKLCLAFDELRQSFVFRGSDLPWKGFRRGQCRLDEASAQFLRAYILTQFDVELSAQNLKDAAETIARMNPFHPIVEYLDGLVWDKIERIDGVFTELFGAEDTEYTRAVSRLFFVSAARRARQPGCKYDTMPILEGAQGVGKSTTIRALCADPSWFTDASINLSPYADAAKAAIELEGVWIYEMAELDALTRAQATKMKAWLSRQRDDFKRPYDRFATNMERTFVVVGTSNESSYLTDTTGNRRYLPVKVSQCYPEKAESLRDQLWAEAVRAEQSHGPLVLPKHLWATASQMQDERLNHHPWLDRLPEILEGLNCDPDEPRTGPVERVHGSTLLDRLGVQSGRASQKDSKVLRGLMPLLGYEYKASIRVSGKPGSGYVLKQPASKDQGDHV